MSRKYFGTDGVRGTVGTAPITADFALRLGYAAGRVLAARHAPMLGSARPGVLIGKDTRISGYMIEAALEAGFSAAGVDVQLCGPLPTPGVAYLTRALRLAAGVVISASHNSFEDNGIKFFSGDGFKLPDAAEAEIERVLEAPIGCNDAARLGRAVRVDDAAGRYIEFCKSTVPAALDLRGLKIVVDCAHGAAYHIAPHVFHELGAEVVAIGNEPDGFNINAEYGATSPQRIRDAVLAQAADLGIALDGDADRVLMVDHAGRLYDGDELLYVVVRQRAAREAVAGVAGTQMTNLALEQALAGMGIAFARAAVGDRYVLELLRERGWLYGGENSGHIICLDRHTTGDGIVSALQVLAAMVKSGKSLYELKTGMKKYPQRMINVPVSGKVDLEKTAAVQQAVRSAEQRMAGRGRVLLRPSGTEPVVRVMVEGEDETQVREEAEQLASVVAAQT